MLSQKSFEAVTSMFHKVSGIQLTDAKRALVAGRLQKLAQARGLSSVDQYVEQLMRDNDTEEMVRLVDKLTTNETYFFREPQHFERMKSVIEKRPASAGEFRVWSAASSSGEEAYSIAMVLGNHYGTRGWKIVGTDLSTAMVDTARRAVYPMERARQTAQADLKRWCLKGQGDNAGKLMISPELRQNVTFENANLMRQLPEIGLFDIIFLRNVLIYFEPPAKAEIVRRVLPKLKPGGLLFTGHAESIANLGLPVTSLAPAVYAHA